MRFILSSLRTVVKQSCSGTPLILSKTDIPTLSGMKKIGLMVKMVGIDDEKMI